MRRELIFNWGEAHSALKKAKDAEISNPLDILDTDKGWTYLTFFKHGTLSNDVLFSVDRLEEMAEANGYFLPRQVMSQHNKVVVTAKAANDNSSIALLGLVKFVEAYADVYSNTEKYPNAGFYGKVGGCYERPEKGRVLVMYSTGDDALLEVHLAVETLLKKLKVKGVTFEQDLSNGLSDIPRLLQGFDDPNYIRSGTNMHRITDPQKFDVLLKQARHDYAHYVFDA